MAAALLATLALVLPLFGGAAVHGLCMRFDWLAFLRRPIDGGRTWRGRRLFGHSKTWRGPLLVALGAALTWELERRFLSGWPAFAPFAPGGLPGAWFGALAGFVAELGELPNSFVKRQLGIAPGGTAKGALSPLFYVLDQIDVVLAWWLVLGWMVPDPLVPCVLSLVLGVAVHPLLTWLGYGLRMRPTAR